MERELLEIQVLNEMEKLKLEAELKQFEEKKLIIKEIESQTKVKQKPPKQMF